MMNSAVFVECDNRVLLAQIGLGNVLAASGGRVLFRPTGVTLPVGNGYRVVVDLTAGDTYTVSRVFVRGAKVWVKRTWTDVYADGVGEVVYRASCYLNG
jgi:hypothetical protein